jgi:hypothetical protein
MEEEEEERLSSKDVDRQTESGLLGEGAAGLIKG